MTSGDRIRYRVWIVLACVAGVAWLFPYAWMVSTSFKTLPEFKRILVDEKSKFYKGFTEKLLAYALGRPVGAADRELVNGILSDTTKEEHRLQEMIQAIVASQAFRTR